MEYQNVYNDPGWNSDPDPNIIPPEWVWDPVAQRWGPPQAASSAPDAPPPAAQDSVYNPLPAPDFNRPLPHGLPGLPGVGSAPSFNFKAPSVDEALTDPGYQFRLGQGQDSLQRWAAAKGTLNDSGTAKALIDYGQNAASQEYANVWNRQFGVAREAFAPQMAQWAAGNDRAGLGYTTEAAYNTNRENLDYTSAWNKYVSDLGLTKWNAEMAYS